MAPPLTLEDGRDGERQKHSRKMKRLRDVSCMRKRETKQDRWGRQRGGRKARWDKLERQPSALKSRLRSVNSVRVDAGLEGEDALVFDPLASRGIRGTAGDGDCVSSDDGGETYGDDADVPSDLALPRARQHRDEDRDGQNGGAHTPSPKKQQQQQQQAIVTLTECPEEGAIGSGHDHHAFETTTSESLGRPRGSIQRARSTGGLPAPRDGANGGSNALRSPLRSPLGGGSSNGLSRSGTLPRGLGSFRGTPSSLHRRLSAPATGGGGGGSSPLEWRGKGQKQSYGPPAAHRRGSSTGVDLARLRAAKSWDAATGTGVIGDDDDEMARAVPPPPPSLFESVFKDKLPSLTPKKATPVTPRLSRDSIVHAIFQSLFGKRKVRKGPRESYGGDWDDEEDEGEGGGERHAEEVDESWIKTGISLSLFSSQALDFACRSTAGADLLHQYVDNNAVLRLVTDLRFEDPRVPSPRLMIIKAIYENCPHLRLPTIRALAHASHDHLMRVRELESWAAKAGIDIADATLFAVSGGTKASTSLGGGARSMEVATSRNGHLAAGATLGSGMGGGSSSSVRVAGRDQSQTLGELLLFVLESFPRFFLGVVPDEEGTVAVNGQATCAVRGGFPNGEAGIFVPPGDTCNGGNARCDGPLYSHGDEAAPVSNAAEAEHQQTRTGALASTSSTGPCFGGAGDRCQFPRAPGSSSHPAASAASANDLGRVPEQCAAQVDGSCTDDGLGESSVASQLLPPGWQTSSSSPGGEVKGGGGKEEEILRSPAWATVGVRSIEEASGGGSGYVDGGSGGDGSRCLFESSNGCGNGVWGRGTASKDLAWGPSQTPGARDGGQAAMIGPARTLRFASEDDGVVAARESAKSVDARSSAWPSVAAQGLAVDQQNTSVEAICKAEMVAQGTGLPPPGEWSSAQSPLLLPPAQPDTSGGSSGWPDEALKEAARSMCILYASHGAPAAGAEAAAAADAPERLQPLASAGSTLCHLWPPASAILLRRLLGTWPSGSSRREVAYLRLVARVACASPPLEVVCPGSRIPLMLFRRLAKCINSSNTKVAQEAAYLVQADFMLMVYLAPNRCLMDLVTNALCANRGHWNADVRSASDQAFDLMLDFL